MILPSPANAPDFFNSLLVEAQLRLARIDLLKATHRERILELELSGADPTTKKGMLEHYSGLRALLLANRDWLLEEWCSSKA
jgi:hypothetical protein